MPVAKPAPPGLADPMKNRDRMLGAMKGFKDATFPTTPFKDAAVRAASDDEYAPHAPKVKR